MPEPVPVIDVNPDAAPIEAPTVIAPETGFDLANVGGIEGGVAGGVVGGIVSGLASVLPPPPPPPPAPVRVGGNIIAPTRVKNVDPIYPPIALSAKVTGIVILEAIIGLDGKVSDVTVLRGAALLDDAAINAVRQWEYTPTLLNGVPIRVVMTVTVNFTLQ